MHLLKAQPSFADWKSNPVYWVERQLEDLAAANWPNYNKLANALLTELAGKPNFQLPAHHLLELENSGLNISGIRERKMPKGPCGLLAHIDGRGLVCPVEVVASDIDGLDPSLPFTGHDLRQTLRALVSAAPAVISDKVEHLRFRGYGYLPTGKITGTSMNVTAILQYLLSFSQHNLPSTGGCAVIELQDNRIVPVGKIKDKINAFHREFGRGDLLIRAAENTESKQFDKYFDSVWAINSTKDLFRKLSDHGWFDAFERWCVQTQEAAAYRRRATPVATGVDYWLKRLLDEDGSETTMASELKVNCLTQPNLWNKLSLEIKSYADSGFIDISVLTRARTVLLASSPSGLYLTQQLLLAALELVEFNHTGNYSESLCERVSNLCERVKDNHQLVMWSELLLSVAETNRFEFNRIENGLKLLSPNELISPQLRGRYWSTRGQQTAFLGNPAGAIKLFDAALLEFKLLENPAIREREFGQTATYRIISLIDDDATKTDQLWREFCNITPYSEIDTLIEKLAQTGSGPDIYRHHALVRFICLRNERDAMKRYVNQSKNWQSGSVESHPWGLISFYRAWMQRDLGLKDWTHSIGSLQIRATVKPTLAIILATLKYIAARWSNGTADYAELHGLAQDIPALNLRISGHGWRETMNLPDRQLLKRILPFNFH